MEQPTASAELIVYACPTGVLERQILAFYAASRERFGANSAHAYPPHITLTGFFHDDPGTVPLYVATLDTARAVALAMRPTAAVTITGLASTAEFHGLLIRSPWLEVLAANFATHARSPSRREAIRPKSDLHLSLAYGFQPHDGEALGAMARTMVNPRASVRWELRLYERFAGGGWRLHGGWPL